MLKIRSDAVEWREIEGEIVALDLRRSVYFALNRTATALWEDLLTGASRDGLASKLQTTFGIDRERAERELDQFVQSLREQELLHPEDARQT